MKTLIITIALILSFALGQWQGANQVTDQVIDEMNRWHVAKFYEDGSWRVNYKDGTFNTGCIETGICQEGAKQ